MAYIFLMIAFVGVIIGMIKLAGKKVKTSRNIILVSFLGIICIAILVCALICIM
jgi:hypothetical protein